MGVVRSLAQPTRESVELGVTGKLFSLSLPPSLRSLSPVSVSNFFFFSPFPSRLLTPPIQHFMLAKPGSPDLRRFFPWKGKPFAYRNQNTPPAVSLRLDPMLTLLILVEL